MKTYVYMSIPRFIVYSVVLMIVGIFVQVSIDLWHRH